MPTIHAGRITWMLVAILALAVRPSVAGTSAPQADYPVTRVDILDRTPLMLAALDNDTECVNALLAEGAAVNARDKNGMTALMWAAPEIAPLLIRNGADIRARDSRNRTPLHYAVHQGCVFKIGTLIACGAEVDARDNWGFTPLFWSVDHFVVSFALGSNQYEAGIIRHDLWKARKGFESTLPQVISVLLHGGANPNIRDQDGRTPLLWYLEVCPIPAELFASMAGGRWRWDNTEPFSIVSQLLEKGADINAQDIKGDSALSWAAYLPDGALVNLLLQHGADATTKVTRREILHSPAVSQKVKSLLQEAAKAKETRNRGER